MFRTIFSISDLKVVQPLLDFCLDNPERVISIEVTDAQAKEGVVKVTVIIINTIIITILITITSKIL